ncbi:MAG: hypothetical protein A3K19_32185 [Lentisphaerae bacterium RIFOXYB12_FULL_65_16]|nr:MAG: hypothetical protein A3K18_12745 [Lentisphaerae bacterium RIFOXYA12_64_32]OGV88760.1 MAG: hypothetical protein A3K19_32185 [Lentisphaerae bacterium RIFOXYB12_FULL_65_16]
MAVRVTSHDSRRAPPLVRIVVACLVLFGAVGRADEPAVTPVQPAFRSVPGVPDLYVLSVAYGDPRTVRQFTARGDKVDAPGPNGFTPLMAAALTADVEMLHALLEAGADIHAKHSSGASVLDLAQVADWRVVPGAREGRAIPRAVSLWLPRYSPARGLARPRSRVALCGGFGGGGRQSTDSRPWLLAWRPLRGLTAVRARCRRTVAARPRGRP